MVEQITKGIKVHVKTKYNGASYRNNKLYHVYAYLITIQNNSNDAVALTHRFWNIFDSLNQNEIIEGEGVVGQTPTLYPTESYTYSSGCFLESTIGAMSGHYKMTNLNNNKKFKVYIPTFQLITPELSN